MWHESDPLMTSSKPRSTLARRLRQRFADSCVLALPINQDWPFCPQNLAKSLGLASRRRWRDVKLRPCGLHILKRDLILIGIAEMAANIVHHGHDLLVAEPIAEGRH